MTYIDHSFVFRQQLHVYPFGMPLWFTAKTYGYGWTPAAWQGWVVLALYVALSFGTFVAVESYSLSEKESVIVFAPLMLLYTVVLLFICARTGEKARWRWGK